MQRSKNEETGVYKKNMFEKDRRRTRCSLVEHKRRRNCRDDESEDREFSKNEDVPRRKKRMFPVKLSYDLLKTPLPDKNTKELPLDLLKNPHEQEKLVLKKTAKNIRLGYKKIIRRDYVYDELYKENSEDNNEFLCCKEYKKYLDNLVTSHKIESCDYEHKGRLEYLYEVAINELSKEQALEFETGDERKCTKETKCPLKYCKDTFCSQCNLCLSNSETPK